MSLIVDVLRRGTPRQVRGGDVPEMLGYPRPSRRGLSSERIIGITAGAIALGFLVVALPACWIARHAARAQAAVTVAPPATSLPPGRTLGSDHFAMALYYQRIGDSSNALAAYRTLLEQIEASADVESLVNLGLVQKTAGRTAEAGDLLRRAVSLDPRHAGAHYNLALLADESGDVVTAVTHYRAFLRDGTAGDPDLATRVRPPDHSGKWLTVRYASAS